MGASTRASQLQQLLPMRELREKGAWRAGRRLARFPTSFREGEEYCDGSFFPVLHLPRQQTIVDHEPGVSGKTAHVPYPPAFALQRPALSRLQ